MSKSNVTKVEKFSLPASTDGVCALVREVLSPELEGTVTRIEIDANLGVRVSRTVKLADLREEEVTWDAALRNVQEFVEYHSPGASSFQVLFDMMHIVQAEGLHPIRWVAGSSENDVIGRWLNIKGRGLPTGIRRLLGVPFEYLRTLPEDSIVLCGSKYIDSEPEEMSIAVKAAVELVEETDHGNRDITSSEDFNKVRPVTRERNPAIGRLAPSARSDDGVEWGPPSYVGK